MSTADAMRYLRLVEHDVVVLRMLSLCADNATPPVDVSDWKVTLLFYTLCIYVKALGRLWGMDIQDHYAIRNMLNTRAELLSIARSYRKVEEWSRDARYEGRKFSKADLSRFEEWFCSVRDCIANLLRSQGITDVPEVKPSEYY